MRCHICDNELSEQEIQQGPDKKWEPCKTCLDVIFDTAFTGQFKPDGDGSATEVIEPSTFVDSKYDFSHYGGEQYRAESE